MTQPPITPGYAPAPQKASGMAVASLVLGIVCFAIGCIPFLGYAAPVCAILAIVLGALARKQVAAGQAGGGGMALAGMILGIIYLIIFVIILILALTIGVSFLHWAQRTAQQMQQQQQQQRQRSTTSSPAELFHYSISYIRYVVLRS